MNLPMNTHQWTEEITRITAAFEQEFGQLTEQQLHWKPNPGIWSIGQNLDHLIRINTSYEPVIAAARSPHYRLPFLAKFPFLVRYMGKVILRSVQPDRRKKMRTFPLWQPSSDPVEPGILHRFSLQQQSLIRLIESCQDLLDAQAIISSPANRSIVYSLATAFDILVSHEWRHFNQAKEVKSLIVTHP